MAECPEVLGLKVLFEGSNPSVDIVAVHGLGSTPDWAWIWSDDDKTVRINWLADEKLLPARLPNSRIMTFNYESKWLLGAPKQRRSLCAIQLLTSLDNKRKEEKNTKYRPLIFIGHSFGGVVVEESLVSANSYGSDFQYLAQSTVGIVFLGTPHRGSHSATWADIAATSAKALGFGFEDSILKDLRADSENLRDLLYQFTLWANRTKLPLVCFFEQHETDYGKRYGMTWKQLVVDEVSACIDGYRKVPLPTDHFKINKYSGPNDPSYRSVYPFIVDMATQAVQVVQGRVEPRTIVEDNSGIPHENLNCLQSLFLSNPQDDLAAIRSAKGDRVGGTCEWILAQDRYTSLLVEDSPQLLWLSGGPGIGKTMISSFLVEELVKLAERSPRMTLAYYFCDDKDERRKTSIAILRGLLLQLLRQRPILFKHIQPDFDVSRDSLFTDFHALWRIFVSIVKDHEAGEIYCLIDALDECEEESRRLFLTDLRKLFHSAQQNEKTFVKFIVTSRRNSDIEESLAAVSSAIRNLQIDSGRVNADLSKYIDVKVNELWTQKKYPRGQKQKVKDVLTGKAEGTFLYVSLVLDDLRKAKIFSQVNLKLRKLPSSLDEVYDRILRQIDPDCVEVAGFVLRWVAIARRPLTVEELAMARALGLEEWEENTIPPRDFLDSLKDGFKCCEPLVYVDPDNDTINLVHQSAKDYLLGEYLQAKADLSQYCVVTDMTNLLVFEICWRYLSMDEFDQGRMIIKLTENNNLNEVVLPKEYLDSHDFLQYACEEWQEHALAASLALVTDHKFKKDNLDKMPTLRDTWLVRAAEEGQDVVVRLLLEKGADVESKRWQIGTPLSWAAMNGHEAVVKLLLEKGSDVESKGAKYGRTPLWLAAGNGHEAVVKLLLEKGADVGSKDRKHGQTPLSWAAENGHETVVKLLLEKGADVESKDRDGCTPLVWAAQNGHEAVVKLLLEKSADVESKDRDSCTSLVWAARNGHEAVVKLLLEKGADVGSKDRKHGQTPLWLAAEEGHEAVVKLLLEKGADVESKGRYGRTPLSRAAENGYEAVVKLLLEKGADVESKDGYDGRTPLSWAALYGHEAVVKLLLEKGADVESKDGEVGRTPLSWAALYGHEAVVKLLLEKGADVESKDEIDGRTPLSWAAENGHEAVVKLLLEKGAEKLPH